MVRSRHKILICLALGLSCFQAYAINFHFKTLTEQDGLPSSTVYSICQDDLGQMLFATRNGVVAYDGMQFFPENPFPHKLDHLATHLFRDNLGTIWTSSGGSKVALARREGGSWITEGQTTLPNPDWLVKGLAVRTRADGTPVAAVFAPGGHLQYWDGTSWHPIGGGEQFAGIHKILFRGDSLLIATNRGLFGLDLETRELDPSPLEGLGNRHVLTLAARSDSQPLMLVGDDWIGRHVDGELEILARDVNFTLVQPDQEVHSLVDRVGDLVFGNPSRTFLFNTQEKSLAPLKSSHFRTHPGCQGIFEDREGHLWFPGLRGAEMLPSRQFRTLDDLDGLFREEVSSILPLPDGQVILGHEGGLTMLRDELETLDFQGPPHLRARVFDMTLGPEGAVWIGADQLGVARLDSSDNLTWLDMGEAEGQDVYALHFDAGGQLWVGTNAGIYRLEGKSLVKELMPGQGADEHYLVRRLVEDAEGRTLAITLPQGIFRLEQGGWTLWVEIDRSDLSVFTIKKVTDQYWLATSLGLFTLDSQDRPRKMEAPGPVIDRPTFCMLPDGKGNCWFGTNAGVMCWDGQQMRHFNFLDGLPGNDISRDGLKLGPDGRVWIGNERGLSIFDPRYDPLPVATPILEFQGFEAGGALFPPDAPIHLSAPPRNLFVTFRGISMKDPRGLSLSTWLEGFEESWHRPLPWSTREVRYSNLPPGEYRLHLRATTHHGPALVELVTPLIEIDKPFWARWWFLLTVMFLVAYLIYLTGSWLTARRYAARLEARVEDRTRELAASEAAVREESERFTATLFSVSEGVITLDGQGRVVLCNPSVEKILQKTTGEMLGLRLEELLGCTLDGGQDEPQALTLTRADGKPLHLEASLARITPAASERAGSVAVLRDITDRLKRENELARTQKLESLGVLAGGLAHDFNNLLTVILGNIDLSREIASDQVPAVDRYLEKSRLATLRAQSLTMQLLTFAKGGHPQLEATSLPKMLHQAAMLAFSGGIHTITFDVPAGLWPVKADRDQLTQAFSNLFINARQAMPEGGQVRVTCWNHEDPAAGDTVVVGIQDEGEGISPGNLSRIFDPYFTTKEQGSGLGLAVVYSIVQKHGGTVEAESAPGTGATFRIELPRSLDEVKSPQPQITPEVTSGHRVLVMDDEEDIRELLDGVLSSRGIEVVKTNDGDAAVAAFHRAQDEGRPFSLALFDLTVPGGKGGVYAASTIHSTHPDFKIAVISGYSQNTVLANYRAHGFSAAMGKPFSRDQLLALVKQLQ